MDELKVIQRFCELSRLVMDRKFHFRHAADCICPNRSKHPLVSFEYSEQVLKFIETAVKEKLAR